MSYEASDFEEGMAVKLNSALGVVERTVCTIYPEQQVVAVARRASYELAKFNNLECPGVGFRFSDVIEIVSQPTGSE